MAECCCSKGDPRLESPIVSHQVHRARYEYAEGIFIKLDLTTFEISMPCQISDIGTGGMTA